MGRWGRWILIMSLISAVGVVGGCASESTAEVTEVSEEPAVVTEGVTVDYEADIEYDAHIPLGDEVEVEFRMVDYASVPDGTTLTEELDDTLPSAPGTVTYRIVSAETTDTLGGRSAPEGAELLTIHFEYLGSTENPSGDAFQPAMIDVSGPTPAPLLVVRTEGLEYLLIADANLDAFMGGAYMEDWGDGDFWSDEWQSHGVYAEVPSDAEWELALKYVGMDGETHYLLMATE